MKTRAVLSLLLGLTVAPTYAADPQRIGEPLKLEETTAIEAILDDPAAFGGKRVRVEGRVQDVCAMEGCWMEIGSPSGAAIQIKVEDGVLAFPTDSRGRQAVAEGKVESFQLTREQQTARLRHAAEERGVPFDPSLVGDGPFQLVRIRGLGAEILP